MPGEYEVLLSVAETLPGNNISVVHPFLSLVININVVTQEHRDSKDKDFCAVMPIGNFTRGALVMKEPGLVIELRSGDLSFFRSGDVTHFNLHYIGQRASMVLHTDREMDVWNHDRNGWENNATLNVI